MRTSSQYSIAQKKCLSMSNSKKYQRWITQLLEVLKSDFGLEVEEVRNSKHKVVKGKINGCPYHQKFSSTPKSVSSASKSVIKETKQKLIQCGVDIRTVEEAQFRMTFSAQFKSKTPLQRLIDILDEGYNLEDNQ